MTGAICLFPIAWGKLGTYVQTNSCFLTYTCALKYTGRRRATAAVDEMTAFVPTNLSSFHSIMPGVGVIVNTANKFVDCCDTLRDI